MYMIFWKWSNNEGKCKRSNKKNANKQHINHQNATYQKENKREEIGNKMSEREIIAQIRLNYFSKNSYGEDISNYDRYMNK